MLPEKQRLDFKERTRYISINPDPDTRKIKEQKTMSLSLKKLQSIRRENFSDGFFSSQSEEDDKEIKL